jgi:hypothetical protein
MTTAADLITAAFLKAGIGSPTNAQTASALISLNNMVSGWGPEIIVPAVTRENLTLTVGDAEYTIGPGGDLSTVRPDSIENAFLRDSNSLDTPLGIIAARDYNAVPQKTVEGRPASVYFIPAETLAKIIFECEPAEAYVAYFEFMKNFTEFAATTTAVTLPPEYRESIVYNLAVSLAEDWDRVISKSVYQRAQDTKDLISSASAASRPVPLARFEFGSGRIMDINLG